MVSLSCGSEAAIAAGRATGIAVALTIKDQTVWQEGFGWADVEQRKVVTAHTPFSLASLTKPFTTATLMRLVATNKLRLEAPFGSYLKVRDPDGVAYSDNASVRLLGAHTAGFPSLFEMFSVAERRLPTSDRELCARYGRLVYVPDTVYEYSNIGYAVLGAVACQSLRQRFETIWFKGRTKAGLDAIVKDGGQPGVSTLCYLVPSERVSCVVLANRTDNGTLVQEIADATMRTLLPDWSPPDALVRTGTTALNASPTFVGHLGRIDSKWRPTDIGRAASAAEWDQPRVAWRC